MSKKRRICEQAIPTPPVTPELAINTVNLKLTIPLKELTKEEQRTLKLRRASAERWKPKLQRPFPSRKEITEAYSLKLLRHYTNEDAPPVPNFVAPRIDKSPRVEGLLKQFPVLSTSSTQSESIGDAQDRAIPSPDVSETDDFEKHKLQLQANKTITKSEYAQRLAWQNFSKPESDRVDRGRNAMVQSALWDHDLDKESAGLSNELPEWRKTRTGKFAKEKLIAETSKGYIAI